jgi:hypothetical protein
VQKELTETKEDREEDHYLSKRGLTSGCLGFRGLCGNLKILNDEIDGKNV